MLYDTLKQDIISSLKRKDTVRTETLRYLVSAIRYACIAKYESEWEVKINDDDVNDCIKKQVKTHRESIEAFEKGNRSDLVNREKSQLTILQEFLPSQLSDQELEQIVASVMTSGEKNFGKIMQACMAQVKGRAEGGRVSVLVKQLLQNP